MAPGAFEPVRFDGVATEGFELVASTFTEFLARVTEDFEHWAPMIEPGRI